MLVLWFCWPLRSNNALLSVYAVSQHAFISSREMLFRLKYSLLAPKWCSRTPSFEPLLPLLEAWKEFCFTTTTAVAGSQIIEITHFFGTDSLDMPLGPLGSIFAHFRAFQSPNFVASGGRIRAHIRRMPVPRLHEQQTDFL